MSNVNRGWVGILNSTLFPVAALVLLSGAPAALAQSDQADPVLKGPQVRDGGVPGMRRPFGDGQGGDAKQRLADRPIPQMEFMRAVGALRDESTPENLRLTDEQQQKIREINKQFEQSMRDFREQHKADFEAMRGQFGDRGRPGRGPRPGPDGKPAGNPDAKPGDNAPEMNNADRPPLPPPPQDGAARQKFEELRAQAPSPKDAQAKVFAVLTDEQKPIVQERLESIKKEMAERGMSERAKNEVHRKLEKARADGKLPPPGEGRFNPDNLPPKLKERLANMTPEERQQAMQKFRERAQNGPRGQGGPDQGDRRGPGGPDGAQKGPPRGPDALPPDLKETWDSLTPEERRFLIQKLRERAAENGETPNPPRRRPPPPDNN